MWDARVYYALPGRDGSARSMINRFNADFCGVYGLYLSEHASIGYSLWITLFLLFKEGSAMVQFADIMLAAVSIFAYYQILRKILGSKFKDRILILATFLYAFSPFVLGIIGDFNLDSASMYFMIIFIACSLYHYESLELIFAFCFCFTKELSIIYYTFYIIFKCVCEYNSEYSFDCLGLLKYAICNIKNYIYALPVVLWGVLFKLNTTVGGWSSGKQSLWSNEGMNCFGISSSVISMKLKQVLILNFNWIFWMIILLGCFILLIKKNKIDEEISKILNPLCLMGGIMIIFGCLYITYTHARYLTPLIPILYLSATVILAYVFNIIDFGIFNVVIAFLLLIQSFYTIDPIMQKTFNSISVGNNDLCTLQVEPDNRIYDSVKFHDSIVYNRQYIYWQDTLKKLLKRAKYDGEMLIVLPKDDNCGTWSILGWGTCFWNNEKGELQYDSSIMDEDNNTVLMKACIPEEVTELIDSMDNTLLYIIPRWADVDIDFISKCNIIREGEIDNKGYSAKYVVMNMNYQLPILDGAYVVSSKLNPLKSLGTNGTMVCLDNRKSLISLSGYTTKFEFVFDDYMMAMDALNDNGLVKIYERNETDAQRWLLEERDGYYMICWHGYALTYDLNENSVKLMPKTGEDNQLWLFTN